METIAIDFCSADGPATYVYVGCYKDFQEHPRPHPLMLDNLRETVDWYKPEKTVQACADIAKKARYCVTKLN
mgnify:FL=1